MKKSEDKKHSDQNGRRKRESFRRNWVEECRPLPRMERPQKEKNREDPLENICDRV